MDQAELLEQARRARWAFPTSRSARRVTRAGEDSWLPDLEALRPRFAAAIEAGGDAAVEIAARTWRLWPLAGDDDEARRLLEVAASAADGAVTPWAAHVQYGLALLAHRAGDVDGQRRHSTLALALAEQLDDPESTVLAHLAASRAAFDVGDSAAALRHAQASYAAAQALSPDLRQAPLHLVAQSHRQAGDFDAAADHFARGRQLNREVGDLYMVGAESFNLAIVQMRRGRADAAEAALAGGSDVIDQDDPGGRVLMGIVTAGVAAVRGDLKRAGAVLDEVLALQGAHQVVLAVEDQADLDWLTRSLGR